MPFEQPPVSVELVSVADGLRFDGHSGAFTVPFDSARDPAAMQAPNPVQMLMLALGACTAMDVICILRKKRLAVSGYAVEVSGTRRDEHPKIFTRVEILHRVRGRGVPAEVVEEAARLSHERYCTVNGQIAGTVRVTTRVEVIED